MSNIGTLLQAVSAGLSGNLPQFNAQQDQRRMIEQQEQEAQQQKQQMLSKERYAAMVQDAYHLQKLIGGGKMGAAVKLLDNRIESINKLGGDPSDSLRVKDLLVSGDPAKFEQLQRGLQETVDAGAIFWQPPEAERMSPAEAERAKLAREKFEWQKNNPSVSQQNSPYFQPIQTVDGLYSFDARTGGAAITKTPDGNPITPAQIDVALQGQLAGAKTGASAAATSSQEMSDLARKNNRAFETFNVAMSGLQSGLEGTSTGYVQGKLPTFTESQQVAEGAISAMAPILKDLFRGAGEGAFTNYDQELLLKMVPTRSDQAGARAAKINNINAIVQAKLGMQGGNQSPVGATPGIAPQSVTSKYKIEVMP